ncbi:IclR family transcriptional regulator C-terminal domain-containing protein, partial [Thermodesulfobacteriota bacterium]
SKKHLWKEIMESRERGYSISNQELSMDLYSIAVPLIDDQGKIVAAINITMDAKDQDSGLREQLIIKLMLKGKLISRRLGYQGQYPKF